MSSTPLVTIGVASYNNARYVLQTLLSVAQQTYRNIELVVVDDCSNDDSAQIISDFLKSCPIPSKFIRHEKNMGVVGVCNRLLQEVQGEFYCLVGSDDLFLPEKIALQIEVVTRFNADLVFSSMEYIGSNGEPIVMDNFNLLPAKDGRFFLSWAFLLGGSFITAPTVMLRTSVVKQVGGYDPRYTIEDMPLWVRLGEIGAVMHYLSRPLVKYRVYSASLSSKLSTLVSHARIVVSASYRLRRADRKCVMNYMLHRIVSNNDSTAVIPPVSDSWLLSWTCRLNQTRLGHYLLYKYLDKKVRRISFQQKLEEIKRELVFKTKVDGAGK